MRLRLFVEVEIRDALMWGEGGPDADACLALLYPEPSASDGGGGER